MCERNQIGNLMEPTVWKSPTVDEYEAYMAPLREALRIEAQKTTVETYRDLTIRKMASFLSAAMDGRYPETFDWNNLQYDYNVDSPKDFEGWTIWMGHSVDLEYARISLYPRQLNLFKKPGEPTLWVLRMMGHPGDPVSMARYARNLQRAGVHFYMENAKRILKEFNKEIGYRKRNLRRQEKLNNANKTI